MSDNHEDVSDEDFGNMTRTQQFHVERKEARAHRTRSNSFMEKIDKTLVGDQYKNEEGLIQRVKKNEEDIETINEKEAGRVKAFLTVIGALTGITALINAFSHYFRGGAS